MKKSTKRLLILFGIGVVGLALTISIVIGTGTLSHRDAAKVYEIDEPFSMVQLNTINAQVMFSETEDQSRLDTNVIAWMDKELNMDELIQINVENDVLTISEHPFESNFLGMFPQPYELKITLSAPKAVIDKIGGR